MFIYPNPFFPPRFFPYFPVNVFLSSHFRRPQASVDSIVHHLQAALIKAKEEVTQLRDQVIQLQTQANDLFESSPSPGMRVCFHMISPYDSQ